MMRDANPKSALQAAVALERLHHEWYHETKETTNYVRHVEWLLERTTCIQKELVKWLASFPPHTALLWGCRHITEEVSLLESDIQDIAQVLLHRWPADERVLLNSQPSPRTIEMMQQMLRASTDFRESMRQWGDANTDDPAAAVVGEFVANTCMIQTATLRAVQATPTDIRAALSAAFPDSNAAAEALQRLVTSTYSYQG